MNTISWKTTVAGIGALLVAVGGALNMLFDGNPNTNPDWNQVVAASVVAVGLIFARDNDKTSKALGLHKPEVTPPTT
jgi:hypothetical protein